MDNNFNPMSAGNGSNNFGGSGAGGPSPIKPGKSIIIVIIGVLIAAGAYYFQFNGAGNIMNKIKDATNNMSNSIDTGSITNMIQTATNETQKVVNSTDPLNKKLNAYVGLLNNVSERVNDSYDRYLSWADYQNGPTGQERNIYGLYELNDYSNDFEKADQALALQPEHELDKIVRDYIAAYKEVEPLNEEAYNYYDQKDYLDDNMAKGKELHPKLVAAFDKFQAASDQLSAEYEKVDLVQRKLELEEYKKSGAKLAYASTNTLLTAQDMYIFLRDSLSSSEGDPAQINADTFKQKIDLYEAALTDLKTFKGKTADIKREYGITGDSLFDSFLDSSDDFAKAYKAYYRAVRDKNFPEVFGSEDFTEGTFGNFLYAYNNMIDKYNFMSAF
ncbi:YiiG family protein [Candidatus Peregrinibacteria bacterium]|nr:YiiG family protein [Candidatus Peregrinibacteria bacterium]